MICGFPTKTLFSTRGKALSGYDVIRPRIGVAKNNEKNPLLPSGEWIAKRMLCHINAYYLSFVDSNGSAALGRLIRREAVRDLMLSDF